MTAATGGAQPHVLKLAGDLDASNQDGYRKQVADVLSIGADGTAPGGLVVDMADVATIDSSGLGLLVHLQAMTGEKNIPMTLVHVPPRAGALLKRTGLDRVFQIDG